MPEGTDDSALGGLPRGLITGSVERDSFPRVFAQRDHLLGAHGSW